MKSSRNSLLLLLLLLSASPAWASSETLNGASLSLYLGIPFAGILLSIALMPLISPLFWHHHYGKVAAGWALAFLVPFAFIHGFGAALHGLVHAAVGEYIPFILLLTALFTCAGGIHISGTLRGRPILNTGLLALGTSIASFMGTTGASMLLIRPLIRANDNRRHQAHVIVFFIFLVSNIGGLLTPLGDPPLFLGFLQGVEFSWTMRYLFWDMLLVSVLLLAMFFLLDSWMYRKEGVLPRESVLDAQPLGLLAVIIVSLRITPASIHADNQFSWAPMEEVAKLFAGIFLTIIPVIAMLQAGTEGAFASVVHAVNNADGEPIPIMYFWATGLLSSFLDNAPTYLVFFNTAGGDPQVLMNEMAPVLMAVSAGAVFMGANTYIGNAPNLMVKAIAEDRGIRMPSFFAYLFWSLTFLLPIFLLVSLISFR